MQSDIGKNTQMRTRAQSDFEKDFLNLWIIASLETMENVRSRINGFLLRDDIDATELKKTGKATQLQIDDRFSRL